MTTETKCPVCEAAHALCLSGDPAKAADFIRAAIVQERKAKEKAEADAATLRAEVERLRGIEAAAEAVIDAEDACDAHVAECNDLGVSVSSATMVRLLDRRAKLRAALRAAGSGE